MLEQIVDLDADSRVVPNAFRVLRAGENPTDKGTYVFDDEAANNVMTSWRDKGIDLAIDYEHQSLSDPPIEAPNAASKFIPEVRNGELWATGVKWTDRAWGYLATGEYRYFSPAFTFDPKTMRVTRLINIALTNNPATHAIEPLVAATAKHAHTQKLTQTQEDPMDFEKLYTELKAKFEAQAVELVALKAQLTGATSEIVAEGAEVAGVVGLRSDAGRKDRVGAVQGLATLRANVLALTDAKSESAAIGTIAAWKANAGEVAKLTARVEEMESEKLTSELSAVLDGAVKDGKIELAKKEEFRETVALKPFGGKVSRSGIDAVKVCIAQLRGGLPVKGAEMPASGSYAMSALQIQIAKNCGRDPNEVAKSLQVIQAAS